MSSINPQLSTHSVGGAYPHGEGALPSPRGVNDFNTGSFRRQPAGPSIIPPLPSGGDAFTTFVGQTCLEARTNLLVEPSIDRKLLQPTAFRAALHRAHGALRDAVDRDPLMSPALQVMDKIVVLNRTADDFRYALHLA